MFPGSEIRSHPDNCKTVRGTDAIKTVFVQLKGTQFLLQGLRFPLQGHRFPITGPLAPLTRALFNCLVVGDSPGFSCIGLRGASKNAGPGRTEYNISGVRLITYFSCNPLCLKELHLESLRSLCNGWGRPLHREILGDLFLLCCRYIKLI